jgi:23S rRNA (guanosine2251-2'-O)-methyltransferase
MPQKEMIFGIHPVEEALDAAQSLDKIFISRKISKQQLSKILASANQQQVPVQFVPEEKLQQYTRSNHQGVIAFLSPVEFYKIEDIIAQAYEKGDTPLLVICDRITDVRNIGAIARTAFGAGVQALIVPQADSAALRADAVKTSAGALMKLPVCRVKDLVQQVKELKLHGLQIVVADAKGEDMIYDVDLKMPLAIIVGNEEFGTDAKLLRLADHIVRIPIAKKLDSYNVSVAAGMVLYEVIRQRSQTVE